MLKKITLLRDRIQDWESYPFSVATIRGLDELNFRSRICFFAGENGTGKSTLLEAIAAHYGLNHRESILDELFKETPTLFEE
jgi:predicted ATPase